MKSISSIELSYLIKEFKQLESSKITKIYNKGKESFVIQLHSPKIGKKLFIIKNLKIPYIDETKAQYDTPSEVCLTLRKQLENYKISKISQFQSERVIEILLSFKDTKKRLIIELFANGNLILTTEDYKVITATTYHKWKDREIKPKSIYKFPKREINLFKVTLNQLETTISTSSKESIVKALALDLSIGGTFSEELCFLANIDKNLPPNKISKIQIKILHEKLTQLINSKISPKLIYHENNLFDVIPIPLNIYNENKQKDFNTISHAIIYYIQNKIPNRPKTTKKDQEIKRMNEIIKKQTSMVKEMSRSELELRRTGEIMYEKYQIISEILTQVKLKLKTKSLHDLRKSVKNSKIIKNIDPLEKTITIEI